MEDSGPSKSDITTVFKRLRSSAPNKVCFDCGAKNPTWSSVTYGVFICIDCSAVHRGLGVHLSFVRSTQLDTNWTWLQLRAMQVGGNSNATQFFRQHGCSTTDAQQKYKSRAAQMYREKLHHQAAAAMRLHGTKLHIDAQQPETSPVGKEADFFEEIEDDRRSLPVVNSSNSLNNLALPNVRSSSSLTDQAYMIPKDSENGVDETIGPKVDHILSDTPNLSSGELGKSTIAQRKPAPKKGVIGGKKGFGAQKVQANFTEIEKMAESLDKQKEATVDLSCKDGPSDQIQQISARLMVQDLSGQLKQTQEKLKRMDSKKADQADRLGIGITSIASSGNGKGGVSHSVMSDMKSIQQEGKETRAPAERNRNGDRYRDTFEDEWEVVSKDIGSRTFESNRNGNKAEDDFFAEFGSSSSRNTSNWTTTEEPKPRRSELDTTSVSDEAQKKFGNAKAISSAAFFGGSNTSFETRANLSRFEGSNAISSADFFGDGTNASSAAGSRKSHSSSNNSAAALPDMTEISDSVRLGVTKVAGKLSNLSRNVSSYISDRYGD